MDVFDEWFGTGDFVDAAGGIDGGKKAFKAKGRRHFGAKGNKQLSNNKCCISQTQAFAKQWRINERDTVIALEVSFETVN
jgi:hypothetical protein